MTETFRQFAPDGGQLILALLVFATALAASFAIVLAVLVSLPPDYLLAPGAAGVPPGDRTAGFWAWRIARNALGGVLVVFGAVLSLPGIPGQGLLTIVAGILLLDFPGRRRLLRRLLGRPVVLQSINQLRAKFSRPPLRVD